MDAHLDVLLAWAERRARKDIEEEDVYVWWGKVRSANRLEVLPHRDDVLAIDEQCNAGLETHLYLTDYRSLYVGQVGEITAEDVMAVTPGERDHMPEYYRDLQVDFWFRLFDIRRLAANDTVDVIAQLRHLHNTRYHNKPVSLYGGMYQLPLIVTRDDDVQWFADRDLLTGGLLWASRDANLRGETERTAADLRDNVLGHTIWTALAPPTRSFLATGEALLRAHREDPRFDFSAAAVEYAKAVETELNALVFSALRRALGRKTPPERETRVDGRPLDLGSSVPQQTLGVIRTLLQKDSIVQHTLPGAIPHDWQWILSQLPAEIETLVNLRNPSAHSSVLGRDLAVRLRDAVLGVGVEGLIARIARARMRGPK